MGYGSLKDVLGIFFIFLIIAIVIFLLLREFNCWYWKINQKIKTLENMERTLENMERKIDLIQKKSI
ncbi:MAG: hypothetical protein IKO57_14640 [Treponema sp.]|nr:hypothetical protein [Treponema sp.]